jgi:hypothetical protein
MQPTMARFRHEKPSAIEIAGLPLPRCTRLRQSTLLAGSAVAEPSEGALVYTAGMPSAEQQPEEPRVHSYPPDEALRHARPLPPRERFVLEDVPEEDWAALREALAEA